MRGDISLPYAQINYHTLESSLLYVWFTVKAKPCFGKCYTCFGCETKTGVVRKLFFKLGLCSAISFERSRRELSIDVAEHRSVLENDQNTLYLRFSFIPRTGLAFPKTGILLWLCSHRLMLCNTYAWIKRCFFFGVVYCLLLFKLFIKVVDSRPARSAGRLKKCCFKTLENVCPYYKVSILSSKVTQIHPVLLADEFSISKNKQKANFTKNMAKTSSL